MRVKVFWTQPEEVHQREYVAADFSIIEDGTLHIQKTDGNTVFFNPRKWVRVEVDNSGK
jgi:hypothetical protein